MATYRPTGNETTKDEIFSMYAIHVMRSRCNSCDNITHCINCNHPINHVFIKTAEK